ncbi:phosphatidylinositol:UDP-GlcNAc transferase PIG-C [Verticillium dahliae VdLs.17]|uniref:Phosphatidylinositol:UDP-GlcNAc transferase PIG-C n=1 Tax=Verticillium dahliae (strain VdLs.17 / ATCC MYA-4575 / FGSC 10137) TaxID=498257 RepID=G2WWB7_VERDV|nr:phosphatidylinositol:UDP-GlcNAc transferase PIG-C [Verticillium dahliae VdLs.17]EGY19887.1 phosphatidylinositol:UDP-GlcNAc transferase PIG-C [Verticillium dahliae VdLs.17]KAH6685636.1 phosphatidylinositol:UDP-GlcNAc transferase PIG-C [Verticillium dahliae]
MAAPLSTRQPKTSPDEPPARAEAEAEAEAEADVDFEPFAPLARSSTLPINIRAVASVPSFSSRTRTHRQERSHLAPEDAFFTGPSPPRRNLHSGVFPPFEGAHASRPGSGSGSRSRSRHHHRSSKHRTWKKLLWVKQSYPDNYTDQVTFLENLKRNPRLQPYDFWPLVADSTVILQHVCSVIIFVVCFSGILQKRVSPMAVVSWSSLASFVGWRLWEQWDADENDAAIDPTPGSSTGLAASRPGAIGRRGGSMRHRPALPPPPPSLPPSTRPSSAIPSATSSVTNLSAQSHPRNSYSASATSLHSATSTSVPSSYKPMQEHTSTVSSTLLGLSPILMSLTLSTTSDSIYAMSFWLLAVNIFSFDYSTAPTASSPRTPASLSTNAALMASTVLASRLPSTGQVFSLTLFSIEVFGLFPVFRRSARHRSPAYHYALSALLVLGAGAGVAIVIGEPAPSFPWQRAVAGMVVSVLISALVMGGCSWWLIGLQKYKNEIYGPWDPARPVIMSRRQWD